MWRDDERILPSRWCEWGTPNMKRTGHHGANSGDDAQPAQGREICLHEVKEHAPTGDAFLKNAIRHSVKGVMSADGSIHQKNVGVCFSKFPPYIVA